MADGDHNRDNHPMGRGCREPMPKHPSDEEMEHPATVSTKCSCWELRPLTAVNTNIGDQP